MNDLYFCPTAGEVESATHGGFDTCCDQPELHLPMPDSPTTAAVSAALSEARKAAYRLTTAEAERARFRAAWHSARSRAADTEADAQRLRAQLQHLDAQLTHVSRVAAGKIARQPLVMRVEGPAAEAALGSMLARTSEERARAAEARR